MSAEPRDLLDAPTPLPERYTEPRGWKNFLQVILAFVGMLAGIVAGLWLAAVLMGTNPELRPAGWFIPAAAAVTIPVGWLLTRRVPRWLRAPLMTGYTTALGVPALFIVLWKTGVL